MTVVYTPPTPAGGDNSTSYQSVLGICNLALLNLGAEQITAMDEGTEVADALSLAWPQVRDTVLVAREWHCAIKRHALVRDTTSTLVTDDWEYVYDLPADADLLRIISILDEYGNPLDWRLEQLPTDATVSKILCDADEAFCRYIYRNNTPSTYSAGLRQALVTRLAAEIAPRFKGSKRGRDELMQEYHRMVLPEADAENGKMQSSFPAEYGSPLWGDAR
jgi:hypothetical protein